MDTHVNLVDVKQILFIYFQAVGTPAMIPYWSLGFQLCRWGYENIDHMKAAVGRMRQYDIPHVSMIYHVIYHKYDLYI